MLYNTIFAGTPYGHLRGNGRERARHHGGRREGLLPRHYTRQNVVDRAGRRNDTAETLLGDWATPEPSSGGRSGRATAAARSRCPSTAGG